MIRGHTTPIKPVFNIRRLSARELLHHPAYQHIDVSRQRSSQILYTTTSKRAGTRLNLRRGVLWCLRILGGIYYWTAVYIAYWTTLNTSSLLHRQASAHPHCDRINGPRVCVGRAERKVHQGQPVVACACGNRGGSIGQ